MGQPPPANVKVGELNAFTANINNNAQAAHERAATAQSRPRWHRPAP